MVTILLPALFGAVQGLTEFLPISSSGHLVLLHELFPSFLSADQVGFDVALHVGTLLALITFFARDILMILRSVYGRINRSARPGDDLRFRMFIGLLVGTIPAATIGFLFESQIETTFRSFGWVGLMLILGGIGFLIIERLIRATRSLETFRLRDALIIGLAQTLAFIPGISRSGSTIATGRALRFSHAEAARFSFLLSIPIVFGAGIKKFMDLRNSEIASDLWSPMLVGFLVSLVVGLLTIRFLLRFFQSHSLRGFAIYRFILGTLLIAYFVLR